MKRAVFLDRDGVINRVVIKNGRPHPPASLESFELLPGVPEAIRSLRGAGFKVIVVTNQPDVATGVQRLDVVREIHAHMRDCLLLDDIKMCCHVDRDQCLCRKPKPGMLLEAAKEWDLDLQRSYMVGDRWRDIEAGRAARCKTILVGGGYAEPSVKNPDALVASLWEAAQLILTSRL